MPNRAIYRWFWNEIRLTTLRSGAPVSFPNIYETANKAFSGYCACGKNPVSRQKEKGSSGSLQLELLNKLWNWNSAKQCKNYSTTIETRDQEMTGIKEKPFRRLPNDVRPCHYDITLVPDITNFIFHGTENVHINVLKSTDTIVLNSLEINIKSAYFVNNNGYTIPAKSIDISSSEETATLVFDDKLPVGKVVILSLEFVGEINDKMKGFYRSKYIRTNGTVGYTAVTQFEPTDARRCFPCWDEPAHKATFDITLKVPTGVTALSNMPIKERTVSESIEILTFERTPLMSTYLVAVVIGEFDYVEDRSSDGVLVRVYTPKSKKEQGQFALEVATKVLPYYKTYFGIAYPLPKIDLIAISDFSSGAMENWGLVTYRETCLLVDPQNTSSVRKQWIALVVAHELAHQWFGNLVTMEWWTHLWLNEGYASFVEFLCVAHLFPEYDIWTQFVTDTHIRALELDALKNSHPIEVLVEHPAEIDEIFDDISYYKGACVIRMLHSYIGDDDFRKGMNLYLKRHSYFYAETEDLWAALEEASKKTVRSVMSTWTKQQGFPIVKVEYRQEGNDRILSLSQERFLADGSVDTDNQTWIVPISVSTSKQPKETVLSALMDEKTKEFVLKDVPEGTWLKINPGAIGFYRTRYSPEAMSLFLPAIKDHTLPPLDRLGLLDDLFAMVQAGHASTVEVLRFMQAFKHEDNYTVWSSIVNCIGKISVLLAPLDSADAFKAFVRNLMRDISKRLGWDPKPNESHLDTLLRSLILDRMAAANDEETIRQATRRFALHMSGVMPLPADLRSPVYRAVLSVGDAFTYDTMLNLYEESDLHEEKERILKALGAIRYENLIERTIEFSMSEKVRAQDTVFGFMSVTMTQYKGRVIAWKFFKEHWKTLLDRYEGGFLLSRLVKLTTENFVSEEYAKDVENFFENHPMPGTERTVQQSIESIRLHAAWLARDKDSIKEFLSTVV
ncbi:puromycin-sensitive aminopeptidase isoform X1 [Vespa velutina]|uniref:puromycin-sensitive aminopeptidase isoform X1 n=2 Tax=Vespa crabro TaxID=7445 RepID=UPI001F03154E|nr:puromycin-sensitive aminopeptidase isoform X1 [Vespa crabro]XP_047344148.1 puromycin-sensitive aminopeptidase isoform X1 [Vespa velutina]XP_047344149.1 puromycin-sensitive aminopeptidase isoform X1 [Vespa velutina]